LARVAARFACPSDLSTVNSSARPAAASSARWLTTHAPGHVLRVVGELVTASYSINLMARGHLLKAGKRIVVGRAEIYSVQAGQEKLVAVFLATLAPVHARRK